MTTGSDLMIKMCQVPDPQGTDEQLVREALKAFRRFMAGYERGGLAYQYKLSKAALEAFKRLVDPQPALWTTAEEGLRE